MTRCSAGSQVLYWEEPIFGSRAAFVEIREISRKLKIAIPHIPSSNSPVEVNKIQTFLLQQTMSQEAMHEPVFWYYTPIALDFSRDFEPSVIVYDCMDELSAFRGAPQGLSAAEAELFRYADLVFTGGKSLFESKRRQHPRVHCFPSSIDREFFGTARKIRAEVTDQADIPHPRLGYCGVIDERMDLDLIAAVADARPEWHFVMLGPVVKISETDLPRRTNIHYLGQKDYRSLPGYFAGWDVGLLPFAINDSTRYISPTKTPEYLAAGLPAVSTPITDVVDPYGLNGLVHIAETAQEFIQASERAILSRHSSERLLDVDAYLSQMSWDTTWKHMNDIIREVVSKKAKFDPPSVANGSTADRALKCSIT